MKNKTIMFNGNEYQIDFSVWEKHLLMHPVRPEEALNSNMFICLSGKRNIVSKDIEKVILDEYYVHSNIDKIITEAEDKYENSR